MDQLARRLALHELLKTLLGSAHVYFQPPVNVQMQFPCIVYRRDSAESSFADNNPYRYTKRYQVTVIDADPDSGTPDKVAELSLCTFERHFTAENLNHDVFNLFF